MPQERENQYPHVTPEEWQRIRDEQDPADTAARAIVARHITGVPRRAFLTGENDGAVVVRGVKDFAAAVLDHLTAPTPETEARVRDIMENPLGL